MRDVEITLIQPVEGTGNYVRVSVNDGWMNDTFLIDGDEVSDARNTGTQALLDVIFDHAGLRTHDIISLARQNDVGVFLEGRELGMTDQGLVALEPHTVALR
ncbi:hypothetical protein G6L37_34960 [Agrobacterium rubi]|nr:hypothetical protein [Agrobacterium rubi]NTF23770.1 hypothetical protein [Agrobacterium rubi]